MLDGAAEMRLGPLLDRHHPARHRPLLRGQGRARRHPGAGPARPEDPGAQARDRARGEERDPREALRAAAPRARGAWPRTSSRYAERLRPFIADTALLIDEALRDGKRGAVRGRPGHDARHRPRHVSLRDLVQPDRRRGLHRAPASGPTRIDRVLGVTQGLRHPGRRGAVPHRARRRGRAADAGARQRVRHHHRPPAPLRLARPGGAALRGAALGHDRARAHQARRALGLRPGEDLRGLPRPRGRAADRLPLPPDGVPRLPPRVPRSCRAGTRTSPSAARSTTSRRGRATTSAPSPRRSRSRSRSSAPGQGRHQVIDQVETGT